MPFPQFSFAYSTIMFPTWYCLPSPCVMLYQVYEQRATIPIRICEPQGAINVFNGMYCVLFVPPRPRHRH